MAKIWNQTSEILSVLKEDSFRKLVSMDSYSLLVAISPLQPTSDSGLPFLTMFKPAFTSA